MICSLVLVKNCFIFLLQSYESHILGTCPSGESAMCWGQTLHFLGRSCARDLVYGNSVSQPFLPILMWAFSCLPNMQKSARFWISFTQKCFMDSCRFCVPLGRGELRSLLGLYLKTRTRKLVFLISKKGIQKLLCLATCNRTLDYSGLNKQGITFFSFIRKSGNRQVRVGVSAPSRHHFLGFVYLSTPSSLVYSFHFYEQAPSTVSIFQARSEGCLKKEH